MTVLIFFRDVCSTDDFATFWLFFADIVDFDDFADSADFAHSATAAVKKNETPPPPT